jgi:hypothetical protein
MTASYNNLASRVEVEVILTTTFNNSTYLAPISNLNPPLPQISFVSQPQSKTVDEYSLATFSCEVAGGAAPYNYQWKKNAINVGTNSEALAFTAAVNDNNASVTVVVTDSTGASITSTAAVLYVTSYRFILDGVTQHHNTSQRLIDISGDIDVSVHMRQAAALNLYEMLIGQTQTTATANSEFMLRVRDSGNIYITVGGVTVGFSNTNRIPTSNIDVVTRVTLVGTVLNLYYNDILVETLPFTRGTVTEPAAVTRLGGVLANGNGIIGWKGSLDNASINGVIMPLNNKSLGANQVGDITSTIVNYNATGWVEI